MERSILALLSMALAAGFMTNATSLSRGYAQMNRAVYRSLIGGEISAYSFDIDASVGDDASAWNYQVLTDVGDTNLELMMPSLLNDGYISTINRSFFSEKVIAEIADYAQVKAVYPRYQIPALNSGDYGLWTTPLRGRDLDIDDLQAQPLESFISSGRWFNKDDQGTNVAIIMSRQNYPVGQRALGVGDLMKIVVPYVYQAGGITRYDYNNPTLIELRVIGVLTIPTREVNYKKLVSVAGQADLYEYRTQFVMQNDEIHIPLETWHKIWHQVGGQEYVPQQLELLINDLSYLEDTVSFLRQKFSGASFYSIPKLLDQVESRFVMEATEKLVIDPLLAETMSIIKKPEQTAMAVDLRLPLMVLIFINAALVVAANLLIMVNERKKEIGILKTVGATRLSVVQMVISEALLITILSSLIGFIIFRLPATLNQITNGIVWHNLLLSLGFDLFLVLSLACLTSFMFGLIPALLMANLSVQEVLQSE